MKLNFEFLNRFRVRTGYYGTSTDADTFGLFEMGYDGYLYRIISSGDHNPLSEWEHVSISKVKGKKFYMPTWDDMCLVKSFFWGEDETVLQFHPKKSEYVNTHPSVLHLWKKHEVDHELPPSILVGFK